VSAWRWSLAIGLVMGMIYLALALIDPIISTWFGFFVVGAAFGDLAGDWYDDYLDTKEGE
jgi:hypothetical protein